MSYRNREHLNRLADRCETGAAQLAHEAENAAEVLATRAGGDQHDPQEWAARKQAAAEAARQYAKDLRAEAASLGDHERPSETRIREAEKVAQAAELGGILIDGRPMAERAAQSGTEFDTERKSWEAGEHPAQQKAREIEATGAFEHVAETINGRRQVPFWQLGHVNQAQDTAASASVADDGTEDAF